MLFSSYTIQCAIVFLKKNFLSFLKEIDCTIKDRLKIYGTDTIGNFVTLHEARFR